MLSPECVRELQTSWVPNLTDTALDHLIELLEKDSPLLVHGCFTRAIPMGCLATHAAWNHPRTSHMTQEAGICWLHQVAGLNPATSHVIREWDGRGPKDWTVRADFLQAFREARITRRGKTTPRCVRELAAT
jgi:hypothetical protein